jgi:hypothetical protein
VAGPVAGRAGDLLSQRKGSLPAADVQPEFVRVRGHVCLSLLMLGQRPRDGLESVKLAVSQLTLNGIREIDGSPSAQPPRRLVATARSSERTWR